MNSMFSRQPVTPSPSKRSSQEGSSSKRPSSGRASSGRMRRSGRPTPSTSDREQAMRDYKLSIEYKHLKQHSPGGIYLVPSFDDIRLFHGVIFVRRGVFTNGIFKFTLRCPPKYNNVDTHPTVAFSSYVYNPHVYKATGEVDVSLGYPQWDPSRHFLVTILTFIKRIFYFKDYEDMTPQQQLRLPNQEALRLFQTDPEEYQRRVAACVKESQRSVYLNKPGCTLRFLEDDSNHETLRNTLKEHFRSGGGDDGKESESDDVSGVVTSEGTLEVIRQVLQNQGDSGGE